MPSVAALHSLPFSAWLLASVIALMTPAFGQADWASADSFNYILGTQAIGGKYQFTSMDPLVEAAEVVRAMGATTMKFALKHEGGRRPRSLSLADLARSDPAYKLVLDMPFAHFLMWANPFDQTGDSRWGKGLSNTHAEEECRQLHDLTAYLLKTYSSTGKTFYLGHWEGDNMLRGSIKPEADARMTPERVQGFAEWLRTRQRAVDDAKRETPHQGVQVWHYTEVNHPTISLQNERPSLTNQVLPQVAVDYVSYSAYDGQNDPALLKATLDYIESKLAPHPGISGKRVFLGEYGFKTQDNGHVVNTPEEQNTRCLNVIHAAIEWGCPFILYWELYNNELDDQGRHRGFWMIDDQGVKQPIHGTYRAYFTWARAWVAEEIQRTGKTPPAEVFRQAAVAWVESRMIRP